MKELTRKRILVTGGAGFLGSHLCERLLEQGANVLCLDNFFTGTRQNVEPDVEDLRRTQTSRGRQHHATFDLRSVDAREIYGRPLTGIRFFHSLTVNLQTANAHLDAGRQQLEFVAFSDGCNRAPGR